MSIDCRKTKTPSEKDVHFYVRATRPDKIGQFDDPDGSPLLQITLQLRHAVGAGGSTCLDLIRKGFFKKDETVLFWHTGGQSALFADKYANSLKT